jgi:hypothetical protein
LAAPWDRRRLEAARNVFAASIAAAFIIEYLLYLVYRGGVMEAFTPPASLLFLPLIAIAYAVYRWLLVFAVNARGAAQTLLPPGIAGASLAFLMTLSPQLRPASPFVIAAVYLAELGVGVKLLRDIASLSRPGAYLFVGGMALFITTLPAAIFVKEAALLPLAFNAVKTAGLALLIRSALKMLSGGEETLKEAQAHAAASSS